MTTKEPGSSIHRFFCDDAGELSFSGDFEGVLLGRPDTRVFEAEGMVFLGGGLYPSCVIMNDLGAPSESVAITLMSGHH
jgi:hypothetical protein